ncbi:hypothetical protein J2Z32_001446 [Paenibacillus turicensis]|uniref:Ig-like domain-containing protein n=1 Tax=Paenibacillus turicensis TaxID=160487 RepID=A0ABS4FQG3_9BACL|nr:hypothetical protein [Paenibacillus turicensis]MBP1904822.1 hypothetical protein [Paenibacillus turicensis]
MKKRFSTIVASLTLFASLSGTALADGITVEAQPNSISPSSGIELHAEACGYYPNGQHVLRLVGQTEVSHSGGSHSIWIRESNGTEKSVMCEITNWYESKTYACACGNKSQTVEGIHIRSSHQYRH